MFLQLIDAVLTRMITRVFDRQLAASKWTGPITPRVTKKIQDLYAEARLLQVVLSELSDDNACGRVTFGKTTLVVQLDNLTGSVVCTCCKEKELARLCKPALAVFAQIERQINHPSRLRWGFLDPKWTSAVFSSAVWKAQFLMPFTPLPQGELARSDLLLWRSPPKSKGRPSKPGRILSREEVEAARAGKKRIVKCGSCLQVGHNRKNCKQVNLDVYYETITSVRVRTALPLTPPPGLRVRPARYVEEEEGNVAMSADDCSDLVYSGAEDERDVGVDESDHLLGPEGNIMSSEEDVADEDDGNLLLSSSGGDEGAGNGTGDDADGPFIAGLGELEDQLEPVSVDKPCSACNNPRDEPTRQFMLITCGCGCKQRFHCKRDCANPLPNPSQRAGSDRWISGECAMAKHV